MYNFFLYNVRWHLFCGEEHKLKSEMEKKEEKISVTQMASYVNEVGWWINFIKGLGGGGGGRGRQVRVCPSFWRKIWNIALCCTLHMSNIPTQQNSMIRMVLQNFFHCLCKSFPQKKLRFFIRATKLKDRKISRFGVGQRIFSLHFSGFFTHKIEINSCLENVTKI